MAENIDGALALIRMASDPDATKNRLVELQEKIDRLTALEAQADKWAKVRDEACSGQSQLAIARDALRRDREAFTVESQRGAEAIEQGKKQLDKERSDIASLREQYARYHDAMEGEKTAIARRMTDLEERSRVLAEREATFNKKLAAYKELGAI